MQHIILSPFQCKGLRKAIIPLAVAGLTLGACRGPHASNMNIPSNAKMSTEVINAFGIFGGASVMKLTVVACGGRITLNNGSATVKDACFTGDTNVVMCTDTTSISAVQCTPAAGSLQVGGNSNDVIAYARVR